MEILWAFLFFLSFHFLLLTGFGIWFFIISFTQAIRWYFFCFMNVCQGNKRLNFTLTSPKIWTYKRNDMKTTKAYRITQGEISCLTVFQ